MVRRQPQRRSTRKNNFASKILLLLCLLLLMIIFREGPFAPLPPSPGLRKHDALEAKNPEATLTQHLQTSNCKLVGSSSPSSTIIIDFEKIRNMDKSPLKRVQNFTSKEYVKYLTDEAGREHYQFLNYISATYGDCQHFTDIGTRVATSSLALASNLKTPVWTFDIPNSKEREGAFRGNTEEEWQEKAKHIGVDIKFHNIDLMSISGEELKTFLGTWFVMLDTFHLPDTKPFERGFFQRMIDIEFSGVIALDDIHLNSEMEKWWKELQDGAEKGSYKTYDITKVGHATGTGLVDFSGKVAIKE